MKKKIFILTLASLFFASSTAFPLVMHYCSMSKSMMNRMPTNNHCNIDMENCPLTLNSSNQDVITNAGAYSQPDCCSIKIIDNHLKDNYLQVKDANNFSSSIMIISCVSLESLGYNFYPTFGYIDYLPPPKADQNHIYLDNSVLLI